MTPEHAVARRSFLSRFGAGAAALGAAIGATVLPARVEAQSSDSARSFQPARHAEDDWFDQVAGKHRLFFDTTSPTAFGQAMFFANNFYTASRSTYGLTDADSALVIGVRHQSTAFAYNDAMWAKYGAAFSERAGGFKDPKSSEVPKVNVYLASGYGAALPNGGTIITALTGRGLRLAVCTLATRANASLAAQRTGGKADDIFKELTENLVPNAHMVPAGIVAVNRAQERGYSFSYVT